MKTIPQEGAIFPRIFIFISCPVDSLLKFSWGAFCDSLFSIWFFFLLLSMSRGPWNHYWIIKEIFFLFFHEKMLAPPPPHLRRQFWLCPRERERIIKEIFFFHEKILAPHLPLCPLLEKKVWKKQREGEGKILKPPLYYFWKFTTLFMWAP